MSKLALDIMLLQRLDEFGIILILIYSLYRKNIHCRPCTKSKAHLPPSCYVDVDGERRIVLKKFVINDCHGFGEDK
jgi:hypothetical protein